MRPRPNAIIAAWMLAGLAVPAPAATPSTRYFVDVPGSDVPLPIVAFSSDARADVGSFSYGGNAGSRPAHGKFSIRLQGSPFATGGTFAKMTVLAQTPAKLITFTFSNVSIARADASSRTGERVVFSADDYRVTFGPDATSSGHTATQ